METPITEFDPHRIEALLEIEKRYNSIKQMHDNFCSEKGATPTFRGVTCWLCEEERLNRGEWVAKRNEKGEVMLDQTDPLEDAGLD